MDGPQLNISEMTISLMVKQWLIFCHNSKKVKKNDDKR